MKRKNTSINETAPADRNRLIGQVMLALKGTTIQTADSIIDEVKFYMNGGHSQANLEKLFDSQIARLKNRDNYNNFIDKLIAKRQAVIKQALALNMPFDRIPFLPVITERYLNIHFLLKSVFFEGRMGFCRLDNLRLSNVVKVPDEPYYIFDVDDGTGSLDIEPWRAETNVKIAERSCLTDCEVVALGVHTGVLARHYLMAIGSRYSNGVETCFPSLQVCNGKPIMDHRCLSNSPAQFLGTPSCSLRF